MVSVSHANLTFVAWGFLIIHYWSLLESWRKKTSTYGMEEKQRLCKRLLLKTILISWPTYDRTLEGMGVNQGSISKEGEPILCVDEVEWEEE